MESKEGYPTTEKWWKRKRKTLTPLVGQPSHVFISALFLYFFLQVHPQMQLISTEICQLQFLMFFSAWQQTCCSVPAHVHSLSLSRIMVVLLINFNISAQVSIVSTVIGKTLQCVGTCYELQHLLTHGVGYPSLFL